MIGVFHARLQLPIVVVPVSRDQTKSLVVPFTGIDLSELFQGTIDGLYSTMVSTDTKCCKNG